MRGEWGRGGSFSQDVKGSLSEDAVFLKRLERREDIPMSKARDRRRGQLGTPGRRLTKHVCHALASASRAHPGDPGVRAGFISFYFSLLLFFTCHETCGILIPS